MDDNNVNTAILEIFEKIESLHKDLQRSTSEIKTGCERDIRLVDNRLRVMEKKMWSIFGALSIKVITIE